MKQLPGSSLRAEGCAHIRMVRDNHAGALSACLAATVLGVAEIRLSALPHLMHIACSALNQVRAQEYADAVSCKTSP